MSTPPEVELAQLKVRLAEVQEELKKTGWSEGKWTNEAKKLLATLDNEWPKAMGWLKKIQAAGAKHLYVTSPLGRRRHLWAYLHPDKREQGAMNRRGPNSIIQGFASDLGGFSGYLLYRYAWRVFRAQGYPLYMRQIMAIHDSLNIEQPLIETAFSVYAVDHAMTSMLQSFLETEFELKTLVGYDNDFKIGVSLEDTKEWSLRLESMLDLIKHYGGVMQAETAEIDKCLHDAEILHNIRKRELKIGVEQTPFITATALPELLGDTYLFKRLSKYKNNPQGYADKCKIKLTA